MAELTYLWDGTVTGDASAAPYDHAEFNPYFFAPHFSQSNDVYVAPGEGGDLRVASGGATSSTIIVRTGQALLRGFLYTLDEDLSFNVLRPTINPRWDRLVLRIDYTARTVRLALLQGTEAVSPLRPALTQIDGVLWESDVAWIFISIGYTYIWEGYIYNKTHFLPTNSSPALYDCSNLIRNSEFMAFSGEQSVGVDYPEFWEAVGAPSAVTASYDPTRRGKWITITDGGMAQYMRAPTNWRTFTIRGQLILNSNFEVRAYLSGVRSNGLSSNLSKVLYFHPDAYAIGPVIEFEETVTFDDDLVGLYFYATTDVGGQFSLGQIIVVEGYHPGFFRPFHEVLPFRSGLTDAAWTATAKSSSTTSINLVASFGVGVIVPDTKAVILRLRGSDSNSAATPAVSMSGRGYAAPFNTTYGQLEIGSITNNAVREMRVIVPVNQPIYGATLLDPQFRLTVVASGALTFSATVEIVGILT